MKNYKVILAGIVVLYLLIYCVIRLSGLVYNRNMYLNNFNSNNRIILIFSAPGCVIENLLFYSCTYGWRGTKLAFTSLNLNYSELQNETEYNDILWWNFKDRQFKRNIHYK